MEILSGLFFLSVALSRSPEGDSPKGLLGPSLRSEVLRGLRPSGRHKGSSNAEALRAIARRVYEGPLYLLRKGPLLC